MFFSSDTNFAIKAAKKDKFMETIFEFGLDLGNPENNHQIC
jgi:hypothetical protein